MKRSARIIVDADACPVKRETIETARRYGAVVLFVASYDHLLESQEEGGVAVVQVDRSAQSADLYIAGVLQPGDILITQDYGLATIGLTRGARVLSFRGRPFTDDNIDELLARRHALARERRGGARGKGPSAMTRKDRVVFQQSLTKLLEARQEIAPP